MPERRSQLESYARFVRAAHAPVSAESVMAAPPAPESPGRGRRRYLAAIGAAAVVVVVVIGALAFARRDHDSGEPVRTGPATTSPATFCDEMRQAYAAGSLATSDSTPVSVFGRETIEANRRELPYLEQAARVAPPALARAFAGQLDPIRQLAALDPTSRADQARALTLLLHADPDAGSRRDNADVLTYVQDHCHLRPPAIELPGGATSTGAPIGTSTPTTR
jgi:hypothetical protein